MQFTANIQRKIKVAAGAIGSAVALAASTTSALAQGASGAPGQSITITTPAGFFKDSQALVTSLLNVVMVIGVVLVFAFLVLGGIEYITSGGEKGKTEAARNKITAAVIGLIILASSYAILTIVLKFLGINSPNDVLKTF